MRSRATTASRFLFATIRGSLILLVTLTGCFRDPDAGKLICQTDDQCPNGYWCTTDHKCERGQSPADAGPDASLDLPSSDTNVSGTSLGDGSTIVTDAFDGAPPADLGADASSGTDGGAVALDGAFSDGPLLDQASVDATDAPPSGTGGVGGTDGLPATGGSGGVSASGGVSTGGVVSSGGAVDASMDEPGGTAGPKVVTFTASPATVSPGQTVTLSWTVSGATIVSINQGIGIVGASGSETVSPTQNTTYILTAQNAAGDSATEKTVVTVVAAPTIQDFTAAPSTISVGSKATLTATFTDATSAKIDNGIDKVESGVGVSTGPLSVSTTYTLTVANSIGIQATKQVTVNVVPLPTITSFTAAAGAVNIGSGTSLTAEFTGGTGIVDHGIGNVESGKAADTGKLTATTRFTLTVTNAAGDTATKQVTVIYLGSGLTGSMSVARAGHSATLLLDGTVLIAGGQNGNGAVLVAEIYDPVSGLFSATKGQLLASCGAASAALLGNGTVLLACPTSSSKAQIYDPSTQVFAATTGSMIAQRVGATATTLVSGKVLVAGGTVDNSALATAELYDPTGGTFSSTGSMTEKRAEHTATLLASGKVLIAGGYSPVSGSGPLLQDAEIYDPAGGAFGSPVAMTAPRMFHTATLLNNGTVVLAGGTSDAVNSLDSVELFDPTGSGSFQSNGNMVVQRKQHATVRLSNGKVFVSGGGSTLIELFDPLGTPLHGGVASAALRKGQTATLLTNGQVLQAGGNDGTTYLLSAELYAY